MVGVSLGDFAAVGVVVDVRASGWNEEETATSAGNEAANGENAIAI